MPSASKEAIVRLSLKATVVNVEVKKPAGKWEKISGQPYAKVQADPDTGLPLGLGLEYQGPRFALELAMEAQNYAGNNVIARDVTISGQTWHAQAAVASAFKVTTCTGNWTMRFLRTPGAWVGLDLGVRTTVLDLQASSQNYLSNTLANATFKSALPMPQVGPCLGWTGLDGRLAARASYHYLIYRGASYHHAAADAIFGLLPLLFGLGLLTPLFFLEAKLLLAGFSGIRPLFRARSFRCGGRFIRILLLKALLNSIKCRACGDEHFPRLRVRPRRAAGSSLQDSQQLILFNGLG